MKRASGLITDSGGVYVAAIAATVTAVCVVGVFGGLSLAAKPSHFKDRIQGLTAQGAQVRALAAAAGPHGAYGRNPVCHAGADDAAAAFEQVLARDATLSKTTLSNVAATPAPPADSRARLVPIKVQFEANGPYDGVLLLMNLLAQAQPRVFVDTVDLSPQTSVVVLKLRGRIFCSNSAPL